MCKKPLRGRQFLRWKTQAQRSQAATDLVRNAYAAMSIYADCVVVQSQDYVSPQTGWSFQTTSPLSTATKLFTDILHPNANGQTVKGEQFIDILKKLQVL